MALHCSLRQFEFMEELEESLVLSLRTWEGQGPEAIVVNGADAEN